jgi:hypothetical protein
MKFAQGHTKRHLLFTDL